MAIALLALLSPLAVRVWLTWDIGLDAAGLYQAAWVVSMHVVTVLLTAVSFDFFPRLSAVIEDRQAADRLMNQQAEAQILLGAPIILGLIGLAPLVLLLLYTDAFIPAAPLLQFQLFAILLRLAAVPAETVLSAAGRVKLALVLHAAYHLQILSNTWISLSWFGREHWPVAVGLSLLAATIVHLLTVSWAVAFAQGLVWRRRTICWLVLYAALCAVLILASAINGAAAYALSGVLVVFSGCAALPRLLQLSRSRPLAGSTAASAVWMRSLQKWVGRARSVSRP